ncbi:hypothetical protein vseg_004267 [Gypsophila vaccaria]
MEKSDRISELPDPLVLDILSRLPFEDYARTSILSKTFKSYYCLYPILYFDHNSFATQCLVSANEPPDINQIRDMFIANVDYQLSRARQLDTPIRKLALTISINDKTYFSRIDMSLDLVAQIGVEDLCLVVYTVDYMWENRIRESSVLYEFPISVVLASKRLRSVDIRGCKLRFDTSVSDPINKRGTSFSSLQHLYLSHVYLDEPALENLIRFCPGIETLVLDRCHVLVEFLWLSKFPRLRKAVIEPQDGNQIDTVDIVDTNLECFKCITKTNLVVSPAACAGIRELSLAWCTVSQPNLFNDLTATFPLLEKIDILVKDVDSLKAANNALRELRLFYTHGSVLKEVQIDCPNLTWLEFGSKGLTQLYVDCPKLRVFRYCGNTIPKRVFFSSMPDLEESRCHISEYEACDTLWLINLRAFLILVMGNTTNVILMFKLPMATFKPEEVEAIPIEASLGRNIHLSLSFIDNPAMENVSALVDGLLWIMRPTTFTVPCPFYYLVKYLCENLVKVSRDNGTRPCWVHQLEDFHVEFPVESDWCEDRLCEYSIMKPKEYTCDRYDVSRPGTPYFHAEYPFDAPNIKKNLTTFPDYCRTVRRLVRFKFQWIC